MPDVNLSTLPDGDLVLECENIMSMEEMDRLRDVLSASFKERVVVILQPGMHLYPIGNHAALLRVEKKLEDLLEALRAKNV